MNQVFLKRPEAALTIVVGSTGASLFWSRSIFILVAVVVVVVCFVSDDDDDDEVISSELAADIAKFAQFLEYYRI